MTENEILGLVRGNWAECSNENAGLRAIASNIQPQKIGVKLRTHFGYGAFGGPSFRSLSSCLGLTSFSPWAYDHSRAVVISFIRWSMITRPLFCGSSKGWVSHV
jgi:hypothetical protein